MGNRQFSTYIYLLFLIIVIGVFAAIAQNDYGVVLISVGCFGFSLILLLKLYSIYTTEKPVLPRSFILGEYAVMAIIMVLFGMRALRIYFSFVEIIFVVCSLILAFIYLKYFGKLYKIYKTSKVLLYAVSLLFPAIILFFISLSLTFLNQHLSLLFGVLSFILALGFIGWYFVKGPTAVYKENSINIFKEMFQYMNLSGVILTMVLLISVYMGLHQINVLPPIYTGEIPVQYQDLVEKANNGEDQGSAGVFKHEIYWEEYQKFLLNMKERENKK